MKILGIFLVFLSMYSVDSKSTNATSNLHIKVENIKKVKGKIMLALYDKSNTWLEEENIFRELEWQVRSKKSDTFIIPNVPHGDYGIAIFHDVNGNRKMDFNLLGVPTEPYGFSNNPRARFSKPSFKKSKIKHESDTKVWRISLIHW